MEEKQIVYKHCLNCKHCKFNLLNTIDMECSIKHTDCRFFGRLRALLCQFFMSKI